MLLLLEGNALSVRVYGHQVCTCGMYLCEMHVCSVGVSGMCVWWTTSLKEVLCTMSQLKKYQKADLQVNGRIFFQPGHPLC